MGSEKAVWSCGASSLSAYVAQSRTLAHNGLLDKPELMRCITLWSILLMVVTSRLANGAMPLPVRQFLKKACDKCHDVNVRKGGLDLTSLAFDAAEPEALVRWVRVLDYVHAGVMPPKG